MPCSQGAKSIRWLAPLAIRQGVCVVGVGEGGAHRSRANEKHSCFLAGPAHKPSQPIQSPSATHRTHHVVFLHWKEWVEKRKLQVTANTASCHPFSKYFIMTRILPKEKKVLWQSSWVNHSLSPVGICKQVLQMIGWTVNYSALPTASVCS